MENNINAHCTICGKGYHVCKSCLDMKEFKPWRTVTDNIEHYMIYLAIHKYTLTKNKKTAVDELNKCNLSDLDAFLPEIKKAINEIMEKPKKEKSSVKNAQENKTITKNKSVIETQNQIKN